MLIRVKVFPSSKKEEIRKKSKNSFEVKVREKPLNGMANRAVLNILTSYFQVPSMKIKLVRGAKTRNKIYDLIS